MIKQNVNGQLSTGCLFNSLMSFLLFFSALVTSVFATDSFFRVPLDKLNLEKVYIDPTTQQLGNGTKEKPYKYWHEVTFKPGTIYLQKRGTIAREQVVINQSGNKNAPIVLAAYGVGEKPVIQGSETVKDWALSESGVYQKRLVLAEGEGLGIVLQNGEPLKRLIWNKSVQRTFKNSGAGTFTYNPNTNDVYLKCRKDANPNTQSIEVSRRLFGIRGRDVSHVHISDMHVRWVSFHGIHFEDAADIGVQSSLIKEVGGTRLWKDIYAGNGIEFGNASRNGYVHNCVIEDTFDSGLTVQTYDSNKLADNFVLSNVVIRKSGFAGIEIAILAPNRQKNSQIKNISISNVRVYDSGKGWSGDRSGQGIGVKLNADAGKDNYLENISLNKCSIIGSTGYGMWLYGETGSVLVQETLIENNYKEGILAQDPDAKTLFLDMESSHVFRNGINEGTNGYGGVAYNVPGGAGLRLVNNTFYNNGRIAVSIWSKVNSAEIRDNVFGSSGPRTHFYSAVKLTDSQITNNYFSQSNVPVVGYAGGAYMTAEQFDKAVNVANGNTSGINLLSDSEQEALQLKLQHIREFELKK